MNEEPEVQKRQEETSRSLAEPTSYEAGTTERPLLDEVPFHVPRD